MDGGSACHVAAPPRAAATRGSAAAQAHAGGMVQQVQGAGHVPLVPSTSGTGNLGARV
jgi:hypothetical protein